MVSKWDAEKEICFQLGGSWHYTGMMNCLLNGLFLFPVASHPRRQLAFSQETELPMLSMSETLGRLGEGGEEVRQSHSLQQWSSLGLCLDPPSAHLLAEAAFAECWRGLLSGFLVSLECPSLAPGITGEKASEKCSPSSSPTMWRP